MYEIKLVSKSLQPLKNSPVYEPAATESEAITMSGKILKTLGCKIIWMKNLDPLYTTHLFETPSNCVGIYSGEKDFMVICNPITLTDDNGDRLPTNQEVGPMNLGG